MILGFVGSFTCCFAVQAGVRGKILPAQQRRVSAPSPVQAGAWSVCPVQAGLPRSGEACQVGWEHGEAILLPMKDMKLFLVMAAAASFLPGLLRSSPSLVPVVQDYNAQGPQIAAKAPALIGITASCKSTAVHALIIWVNCLF